MKNYEKIAYGTVGVIRFIAIITSPFVKLLTASTNLISKVFGVSAQDEEVVTEEEIRMMVDVGEEKGTIDKQEKNMINNVFEFNDKVVSEIMVPRTEIDAIEDTCSIEQLKQKFIESGHSKIVVYHEDIDHIVGYIVIRKEKRDMILEWYAELPRTTRYRWKSSKKKFLQNMQLNGYHFYIGNIKTGEELSDRLHDLVYGFSEELKKKRYYADLDAFDNLTPFVDYSKLLLE